MPNKIKISLEAGKMAEKEWNDDNLNSFINDCINVENNINEINLIKEKINKCNLNKNGKVIFLIESVPKIKNYELIYRATEHGDSNNASFSKCKTIPNLVWIMKDRNNNIFGCFTSIAMNSLERQ